MTTAELLKTFSKEEGIKLFNSKKTDKELYDEFVKKGLTDSFDTFVSETQKAVKEIFATKSMDEIMSQLDGAELTDEQLESVAGGCSDSEHAVETTVPVAGVLAVTGAVAAAMW